MTSNKQQRIEITVQRGNDHKVSPKVSIFAAIDTSNSMKGKKIEQAIQSLKSIIEDNGVPNKAKITVRKFNTTVDTLVARTKHNIDLERLEKSLKECEGKTALYDAFGQTINEIPFSCIRKHDHVHIIVLTDGEDNSSTEFNLKDISVLLNEKIKEKVHCTFIQAGTVPNNIISLAAKCTSKNFSLISVDDTSDGIKLGLEKAQSSLQNHLKLIIQSNRGGMNENAIAAAIKSLSFVNNKPYQNKRNYNNNYNNKYKTRIFEPSSKSSNYSRSSFKTKSAQSTDREPSNEFSVWVGNIPYFSTGLEISNFFKQWGNCNILKMERSKSGTGNTQWAVVNFVTERSMKSALKEAKNVSFLGSVNLKVELVKSNNKNCE